MHRSKQRVQLPDGSTVTRATFNRWLTHVETNYANPSELVRKIFNAITDNEQALLIEWTAKIHRHIFPNQKTLCPNQFDILLLAALKTISNKNGHNRKVHYMVDDIISGRTARGTLLPNST